MSSRFDEKIADGEAVKQAQLSQRAKSCGIRPKGHMVLGLPYEKPKNDSRIVIPETVKERTQMLEDRILVIAIGAACWNDEPEPRAKVGDLVLVPFLAGRMVRGKDGTVYRAVNDRDIMAECDEFDM